MGQGRRLDAWRTARQDQGWHQVAKAWWFSSTAKSPEAQHSLPGKPRSDTAGTGDTAESSGSGVGKT